MDHLTTLLFTHENFFETQNLPWERIFMLTHWFFIQKKSLGVYFTIVKFFTPLFYWWITFIKMRISTSFPDLHLNYSGGGRKLLCGKKLFIFWQSWFLTFTRRKNQLHRLKTHHFEWKRNWAAYFIFSNQNGRYPLKEAFFF